MTQARIRRAFESTLKTWADANTLTVAWENVTTEQPTGSYVRAFLMPGRTTSQDLGGLHRHYVGIFQVSIVCPVGTGPGAADALADSLSAAFTTTAPITVSGLEVWLAQPMSAAAGIQERDRWVIPCSAPYLAHSI